VDATLMVPIPREAAMAEQVIIPRERGIFDSGFSEIRLEEDLVFARSCGPTTLEDMKLMYEINRDVVDRYGYVLVLIDCRLGSTTTPEARKYQSEQLKKRIFPSHTALYGIGIVARTTVTLMLRATELLTGKSYPVEMVPDEESARKILVAARERLRQQVSATR
jgi:hypothetical protein